MKKIRNILWGLVLVALGILLILKVMGISLGLSFKGWWTFFIIVPCFIGLFNKGDKTGDVIGLLLGIALLLGARGIVDFSLIWKLALPVILIVVGASIIIKSILNKKTAERIENIEKNQKHASSDGEYIATFGAQNVNFSGEQFKGAKFSAIFGGIKCDLRNAVITEDVLINAEGIFGGVDIFPPSNVKVQVKSTSIFGGVKNDAVFTGDDNSPTIYVKATCLFGGVDIK